MDRGTHQSRNTFGQLGTTSRRRPTPSPPEDFPPPQIPANPQHYYPFDAKMRMTRSMRERKARIKEFQVLNPIYPDLELLTSLDIRAEIERYFVNNGLGFVFDIDPPLVYETLVREFVYSFVPEWRVVKRQRTELCRPERHVVSWTFRLGGVERTYSRDSLLRIFNLDDRTKYPYVRKSDGDRFWKLITRGTADFVSAEPSTKVADPVWRLVHRFLATCVLMRKDEGRWITKTDWELLCCLHDEVPFDTLIPITKTLEEATLSTFRGKYISGGPFVTMIATDIGFFLDHQYAMPRRFLGEDEMIHRGFIKIERRRSEIFRRLVGRDIPPRQNPPHAPIRPPPPPAAHYEVGSSSGPQPGVTMDDLSAQLRALTAYTHEGFLWAGDVFTDLYTRMGFEDYPPPPPHPSHILHSDAADTEDDDDDADYSEGESESGDEDDDDMDEDSV